MESNGIISRVSYQPLGVMEWYQSQRNQVCVCVYLSDSLCKSLNESVLQEVYPLPTVDDTLGQLTGATMLSHLDANSSTPLSRIMPADHIYNHCGRFCFNKLSFGNASKPELFQLNTVWSQR